MICILPGMSAFLSFVIVKASVLDLDYIVSNLRQTGSKQKNIPYILNSPVNKYWELILIYKMLNLSQEAISPPN